jgi:hypothetical protein
MPGLLFCAKPPSAAEGGGMLFRLVNTEYDHHTERGYVEFRANDDDGGEIVIATILSFCSKSKLSKPELRREIVRKARYALKRAAVAT